MPSNSDLIGKRVFVPDLDQFGKVISQKNGMVENIQIKTDTGEEIISVIDKIVLITQTLKESGIIELIVHFFRKIFGKD